MVLEPGYPGTTGFRKVVKATIFIKKKEGMSDRDFIEHYNHKHAQMAAKVLEKHNVITYSLEDYLISVGLTPSRINVKTYHLERDRTIMQDMLRGQAQLLPYDAICTFVFPDWLSFARFMYDKESKALTADHNNFMDESQMKMMCGDEYLVIDETKRVG